MCLRRLLWLIALTALSLPSAFGPAAASDGMSHPVMRDCRHETPPPLCPEKGTANHAAGLCCPLMSGVVALLPPATAIGVRRLQMSIAPAPVLHLTGLSPHTEPPPPRV